MGYKREEAIKKSLKMRQIRFSPDPEHAWLESVIISEFEGEDTPLVEINTRTRHRTLEDAHTDDTLTSKTMELSGIKDIFERGFSDPTRGSKNRDFLDALTLSGSFDAGPASDIRRILRRADIPRDIQVAVMNDLEKLWARQKGR